MPAPPRLPMLVCLLSTLLIPGCAGEPPPPPEIRAPIVAEATRAACPEPPVEDRAEARRVHARPRADTSWPDGRPAVSLGALQSAVDERDLSIARKNRALDRAHKLLDGCRGEPPATKGATS